MFSCKVEAIENVEKKEKTGKKVLFFFLPSFSKIASQDIFNKAVALDPKDRESNGTESMLENFSLNNFSQ